MLPAMHHRRQTQHRYNGGHVPRFPFGSCRNYRVTAGGAGVTTGIITRPAALLSLSAPAPMPCVGGHSHKSPWILLKALPSSPVLTPPPPQESPKISLPLFLMTQASTRAYTVVDHHKPANESTPPLSFLHACSKSLSTPSTLPYDSSFDQGLHPRRSPQAR